MDNSVRLFYLSMIWISQKYTCHSVFAILKISYLEVKKLQNIDLVKQKTGKRVKGYEWMRLTGIINVKRVPKI